VNIELTRDSELTDSYLANLLTMCVCGRSRQFAATQHCGCFRRKADGD